MNPEILQKLRKERRLSQQQLGKEMGVSASAIGMYEQGRREPDHEILLKLAKFFDVSVDYLMDNVTADTADSERLAAELFQNLMQQNALMFRAQKLSERDFKQLEQAVRQAVEITVTRKQKLKSSGE